MFSRSLARVPRVIPRPLSGLSMIPVRRYYDIDPEKMKNMFISEHEYLKFSKMINDIKDKEIQRKRWEEMLEKRERCVTEGEKALQNLKIHLHTRRFSLGLFSIIILLYIMYTLFQENHVMLCILLILITIF